MNRCTKQEFDDFIAGYPNRLEINVVGMCIPEMVQYNDFSDGKKWPESVAAQYQSEMVGNYRYTGKKLYWIKGGE
jgi:hypothetical protein